MKSYDDYLNLTHDEYYEAHYGSDDYCEECDCAPCQCEEEDFDEPDEPDYDSCDVCFGGVDW